jgi:hypothetical protein
MQSNRADGGLDIVMRHFNIQDGARPNMAFPVATGKDAYNPSSLQVTDDDAKAVQKTPNRVSLDQIKEKIAAQYTFTLDKVLYDVPVPAGFHPETYTLAIIVMDNGWVLNGESAPADPENFDAELGKKFALENAMRKIWPLEGYLLREILSK